MMRSCLRRTPRYAGMTSCSLLLFFVCLFICFNLFLSSLFLIFVTIFTEINFPFPPPKKNNKSNNNNNNNDNDNNSDSNNSESDFCSQIWVLPLLFREGTCLSLDLFKVYLLNALHFY